MKSNYCRELYACFYSFVPFFLSIPFLFVYFLGRISISKGLIIICSLFIVHFFIFRRFYSEAVFIRAHFLTFALTIGLIWSASSPALGLFTAVLAIFHLSEYISVGLWCPRKLTLESFLINQSREYHGALLLAFIEYFIEKMYLLPDGVPLTWLWILVGLIMIIFGEFVRKLAMFTAKESFSHIIEDKVNQEHRLITHGIYAYYRHPSYVGWFCWACGTQVLLANPFSFIVYIVVSYF